MTTPRTESATSKKSTPKTDRSKASPDAIALLKADHRKVEALFADYEKASGPSKKHDIAMAVCDELSVHAALEETAFYPAAKQALGEADADLVSEATVEHASLKWLIAQLQKEPQESELYDAKVTVLKEYVTHHVKEEEKEMFPKLKKTDLDLHELGEKMEALKPQLQQKLLKQLQ